MQDLGKKLHLESFSVFIIQPAIVSEIHHNIDPIKTFWRNGLIYGDNHKNPGKRPTIKDQQIKFNILNSKSHPTVWMSTPWGWMWNFMEYLEQGSTSRAELTLLFQAFVGTFPSITTVLTDRAFSNVPNS